MINPGASRDLKLAAAGAGLTLVFWAVLNAVIWMPYWRELRRTGWIYVDDIGASYLLAFGPWLTGLIFLLSFVPASVLKEEWQRLALFYEALFCSILPALLVFLLLNGYAPRVWNYPGASVSILVIGLLLIKMRRRL